MMVSGIVFLGVSAIVALATVVFLKAVSLTRVVAPSSTKEVAFHRLLACLLLDPRGANIIR